MKCPCCSYRSIDLIDVAVHMDRAHMGYPNYCHACICGKTYKGCNQTSAMKLVDHLRKLKRPGIKHHKLLWDMKVAFK